MDCDCDFHKLLRSMAMQAARMVSSSSLVPAYAYYYY
jgi:hypothetical protein